MAASLRPWLDEVVRIRGEDAPEQGTPPRGAEALDDVQEEALWRWLGFGMPWLQMLLTVRPRFVRGRLWVRLVLPGRAHTLPYGMGNYVARALLW